MNSAETFKVEVPETVLADLHERIARTRWPDSIRTAGWEYGTNIEVLKNLVYYWQEQYDWRRQEAKINSFPQFLLPVDGLGIHFVHMRSKNPNAIPLILTHGWP